MEWISVKKELPENNIKVRVKVPDLRYLMMGIENSLPPGEYTSILRKNPSIYCCNNTNHKTYHERLRWSNDAGYYATHWMQCPELQAKE